MNKEREKLIKQKESSSKELKEDFAPYISENYSSIYGNINEFNAARAQDKASRLYEDLPNMQTRDSDYYRRGHFIRDEWALRYETLGQDLDTEGRILIDENA